MHPDAYVEMAALQDSHWWFLGRRTILSRIIRALSLPPSARILEIGSGMGGNLRMLQEAGEVTAIEADEFARHGSHEKFGLRNLPGTLPGPVPEIEEKFDLVCLLDVLEHVGDDGAALVALGYLLHEHRSPDGARGPPQTDARGPMFSIVTIPKRACGLRGRDLSGPTPTPAAAHCRARLRPGLMNPWSNSSV